jgi:adenosylcobinamide-GDP ribazoletransferase
LSDKRIGSVFNSLLLSLSMYSIIPMPNRRFQDTNLRWALAWFPLIGAIEGGLISFWCFVARRLGLNSFVFAALAVSIGVLLSGGIHLDGFCDSVDAIASRREREEQLQIMKDPHVGPFGVFFVSLLLISQTAFYSQVFSLREPRFWIALGASMVMQRALSALLVLSLPRARTDGLAHIFAESAALSAKIVVFVTATLSALVVGLIWRAAAFVVVIMIALWYIYFRFFCLRKFNGVTGDLAGMFVTVAGWISLFGFAILAGGPMT